MPEVNQYVFTNKELLALLVKEAGIHDGKWMLLVNFGFSAANVGTSPDQASPAAMVALLSLGIQKAQPDSPPSLVLDAAEVNPGKSST
jgi:hypothetical protein